MTEHHGRCPAAQAWDIPNVPCTCPRGWPRHVKKPAKESLPASASPHANSEAIIGGFLDRMLAEARTLPVGHEIRERGSSTFNWTVSIIRQFRERLSASASPGSREGRLLSLKRAAMMLTKSLPDELVEALRAEWGNTNLAVLKYWRDELTAELSALPASEGQEPPAQKGICRRCGFTYEADVTMCDDPSAPGAGSFGVCGGTVTSSALVERTPLEEVIARWRKASEIIIRTTNHHPDPAATWLLKCADELEALLRAVPSGGEKEHGSA